MLPFGIGLVLMIRPTISKRLSKVGEMRMFQDMVLHNVLPCAKHAPMRPIHEPPHWPLFSVAIMSILMFTFMVFRPLNSKGLRVTWKNRGAVVWEKSPWPDTLEVYIRTPARFFVNGEEVDRNNLSSKLIEQLARRAEWTVYFEADADTAYRDTIYAIDVIQGCGAKLIWVTPKMREKWQHATESSPKNEDAPRLVDL